MAILYPNGLGETLGDVLAMVRPIFASGNVWFVSSITGTDAASPAGRNKEKPLATIAQANTNAADNDIICIMAGHLEEPAAMTISKKLCFVGGGLSAGLPTVKFAPDLAGNPIVWTVTGTQVEFRNIWFAGNQQANTATRMTVSGSHFRMVGCYMECGQYDLGAGLTLAAGADSARIVNSTFVSTAISTAAQPASAIKTTAAISDLELDGLVLSGGTVGFSNYHAFDGSAAAITRLKAQSLSLLLGADMLLHSGTTGWVNPSLTSGSSRVDW